MVDALSHMEELLTRTLPGIWRITSAKRMNESLARERDASTSWAGRGLLMLGLTGVLSRSC